MKIIIIAFLCACLLMASCKEGHKTDEYKADPEAIELNNHASQLIFQDNINGDLIRVDSLLYEALSYAEEAIKSDSLYYMAYSNKATILCKLHRYEEAIDVLEEVLEFKPNYAEGIQAQGFIFEKMNKQDKALDKYEQALKAYNYRIKKGDDKLAPMLSKAFLLIFTENKNEAIKEIDNIIQRFPDSQEALLMKQTASSINREEFIRNYN